MRFLLDQDVYASTLRLLTELGHDVLSASQVGLSSADDEDLLRVSQAEGRILVTRDRDFGALVFARGLGTGVIYLRMLPSTQALVHLELERILTTYTQEDLKAAFVVVEPGGHRLRRPLR